jgi:hypothetical protein
LSHFTFHNSPTIFIIVYFILFPDIYLFNLTSQWPSGSDKSAIDSGQVESQAELLDNKWKFAKMFLRETHPGTHKTNVESDNHFINFSISSRRKARADLARDESVM